MRVTAPVHFIQELQLINSRSKRHIQNHNISTDIAQFLSKNYSWLIILLGTFIIGLETIEHLNHVQNDKLFYYFEIGLNALLLAITAFLTRMLLNSLAEGLQAARILRFKNELGEQLSACQDNIDLSRRLVRQLGITVPLSAIELYLYEIKTHLFRLAAEQGSADLRAVDQRSAELASANALNPHINADTCQQCILHSTPGLRSLRNCAQRKHAQRDGGEEAYCLPFEQANSVVGILHLYPGAHKDLDPEHAMLLENINRQVALYLSLATEKKAQEENRVTQKVHAMELDIARDLHDTIGQNISYLRMKLDYMAEAQLQAKANITKMANEIRQMRDVANESHDLVRGTLAVLQSGNSGNLLQLFNRFAEQVADRSEFQVDFTSQGTPRDLPHQLQRSLFFIFRELMSNIEKHTHASKVCVDLSWTEDGLTLTVTDDGCGFDPAVVVEGNHYGLRFLRERAERLGGSLSIHSQVGYGTNIVVHVPCE